MTTQAPLGRPIDEEVPVLIVGGGGAGLTASMLLSTLGVETLLVSALPTTSDLPKAHVLNQRTMEILSDLGVAEHIYAQGTPPAEMAATAWYAGLHGDDEDYGRRVAKLESWGAGGADEQWAAASACATTNLPQIRLEPILKRRAEELAPGRVRFNHELLDVTQDADSVTARIRDKDADREYHVRARYVIGADGGRTLARQLGVTYEGLGHVTDEATVHATVDLSRWGAADPDVLLRWIWSPDAGVMVVTAPMGPTRWGADSEEWVIHLNYAIDALRGVSDDAIVADVRAALGLQDADIDVHRVTRWSVEAVLASTFRVDHVFLVGDAAHRHPPTGGLGLTSAVQDVHNLCWKLAAVLRGEAGTALLDTYEAERRPVVAHNCQRSLESAINHFAVGGLIGVTPESSREQNWAALRRLWSDDPADADHRAAVMRAIRAQSMEFREQNIEYGYAYDSAAVVPDGTPAPQPLDDIRLYRPSTRPGAPLPHAWIDDAAGTRRATKDLVAPGRFLLVAGEDGDAWCHAAREVGAHLGVALDAVRIGHLDGDLYDPRCTWLAQRQIAADGAILVRPDRFVAWRSLGAADAPDAVLRGALEQVLGRAPQSLTTIPTIEESAVIRPTFHHVNLKTTRLQEMIDWYTTVCGVEVQHQDEFGAWLTNDAANHRVALLAFPNFTDDPDKGNHTGLHHSAFEYDSFDDMMASYVRLRDAGITPAICLDHGMTFSYYYADPDGNNVELQVDTFGDWAASSAWMRESDAFRANPIGTFVEPEQVLADHAAGVPFAEIHERAMAGAYAPEQAPVAVPHAEV